MCMHELQTSLFLIFNYGLSFQVAIDFILIS